MVEFSTGPFASNTFFWCAEEKLNATLVGLPAPTMETTTTAGANVANSSSSAANGASPTSVAKTSQILSGS
jgi:hypothetical protein